MSARIVPAAALLALAWLHAAPARAQTGFGTERPAVIGLENIAGVSYHRMETDDTEIDTLHAGVAGLSGTFPLLAGPMMRLGVHYFVSPPLSLGVLLHYSDKDEYGEALYAAARVGASFPMGDTSSLWLRGGVGYFSFEAFQTTRSEVRPGGELLFVLEPVEHFGFLVGGMFEAGLAGTIEDEDGNESDYTYLEGGLTFGVFASF